MTETKNINLSAIQHDDDVDDVPCSSTIQHPSSILLLKKYLLFMHIFHYSLLDDDEQKNNIRTIKKTRVWQSLISKFIGCDRMVLWTE